MKLHSHFYFVLLYNLILISHLRKLKNFNSNAKIIHKLLVCLSVAAWYNDGMMLN